MKKIKVGILGLGYIAATHIDAVRRINGCEIAAVADTNIEYAKSRAELYGVERYYGSLEELLADPEIDVVHNCTPNHLHTSINKKIIEAGKHLFSEKPLARTYAEALELVEVAKKHPEIAVGVNFNYRLNPMVQEMKYRYEKGDIGKLYIANGAYQQDYLLYDTDYNWRLEPDVCGISCAVADIGSHWMDAVQYVTGSKIVEVMADLVTVIPYRKKPLNQAETFTNNASDEYELRKIENEEYAAIMFKMDNGASGVYHVSEVSAGHGCHFHIELNGSKASMKWNQEENDRLWMGFRDGDNRFIIRNPNTMAPEVRKHTALAMGHPEGWNDAFCGNFRAFYNHIASGMKGDAPYASLDEAAYIVRLIEAIVKSSKERRWVEV